ncbi:MAG: hypothetical protein RQM92_06675 [Candidatus Syntrophopropionicum ammoniitolerans]
MALHKDTLNVRTAKDIDWDLVKRIILVDTKRAARLDRLADLLQKPGMEIHIYDHHPHSEDDVGGNIEVVEMVGGRRHLTYRKNN